MSRSRNIKPGFFSSEQLGQCEHGARLLFAAMWTLADREGRLEDRPMRIRAYAFPYDAVTTEDVERWLSQLSAQDLVLRYESRGIKVLSVVKFAKHQSPHVKEVESQLPPPEIESTVQAPDFSESTCEKAPDLHQTKPHSSCDISSLIPDSLLLIPDSLKLSVPESGSSPAKAKRFTPPTVAQVRAYGLELEYEIDAERFCDYYQSVGWLIGKGKPMKDWQSAVRGWRSRELSTPMPRPGTNDHLPLGFTAAEKAKMAQVERERAEDGLA